MSGDLATIEENGSHGAALVQVIEQPGRLVAYVDQAIEMMDSVRQLQKEVLRPDVDYGVIPGTGKKPTLLKSGAETLLATFRLSVGEPQVEITEIPIEATGIYGHREYKVCIPVINRADGCVVGHGNGSCSTMESKYRFRNGERTCPSCGKTAIIKGKAEYGGGWLCWKKKDGCGEQFGDNDPQITDQVVGQIENANPADQWNTALKMAVKRALVAGALITTAASGVFTQDVEDFHGEDFSASGGDDNGRQQAAPAQPAAAKQQPKQAPPKPAASTSGPPIEQRPVTVKRVIRQEIKGKPVYILETRPLDSPDAEAVAVACTDEPMLQKATELETPQQFRGELAATLQVMLVEVIQRGQAVTVTMPVLVHAEPYLHLGAPIDDDNPLRQAG